MSARYTPPTAIDLFSGCGGLSVGLLKAGFSILAAIENDPVAAYTYSINHPGTKIYSKDIRELDPALVLDELNLERGQLDVLAGCPPCQGFSRLKNHNQHCRLHDPRNKLVEDFLRFIEVFFPSVIMLENVPQIVNYSRFKSFCAKLKGFGYALTGSVVDVARYGVPQRRKRYVMLASRIGIINHPEPSDSILTVRDALYNIEYCIDKDDCLHVYEEKRSQRVKDIISLIPKNGGSRTSLPNEYVLECHRKSNGFYDVYGRMHWDRPSPTITTGCINPSKGRFLHPEKNRAITLREAALLQTFPMDYKFPLTYGKYAVARMIGNALPPEFSRRQATAICSHLAKYRK